MIDVRLVQKQDGQLQTKFVKFPAVPRVGDTVFYPGPEILFTGAVTEVVWFIEDDQAEDRRVFVEVALSSFSTKRSAAL